LTTILVVDAFTDEPFSGNPAAVCVLDEFPPNARMQNLAREMNLSETAFVVKREDGDYDLRWYTPLVEVDLCGHATLAAAHVLGGDARFHTRSGVLTTTRSEHSLIEMDFPDDPLGQVETPTELAGWSFSYCGVGKFDMLAVLPSAQVVRDFVPDQARIAALGTRGLIITAQSDRDDRTCVSRVFAPNAGIAEDPVTGSAHCTIAGYWGAQLGVTTLVGEQASTRGGTVHMRLAADRVILGGRAVTVSEVRILV
jgi:predicted PhzF superfamily epimerase YddE/YHI9